jgi:glycerophosphoryl diester phosphodiesterase
MSYDIGVEIPLVSRSLIRRAHRRNMAVQYWTINDADDMRKLINMGCDCIMTDDPELMRQVLDEME